MALVHVKATSKWKTVNIPESVLSGSNFDDLIELQELSDYELEKIDGGANKNLANKKGPLKKKRKKTQSNQVVSNLNEESLCHQNSTTGSESEDGQRGSFSNLEVEEEPIKEINQKKERQTKKKRKKKLAKKTEAVSDLASKMNEDNVGFEVEASLDDLPDSSKNKDMAAWEGLGVPELVLAGLRDQGFTAPTSIQTLTIPHAIRDRLDIIGAAETGSGKTLAFSIPVLHHIIRRQNVSGGKVKRKCQAPLALILEPTRELAIQVKKHIVAAAKYTNIKAVTVVGGMSAQKQARLLHRRPEIVIATPGRLWELIEEGLEHLQKLSAVEQLVVDEADRMVERGHFDELAKILALVNSDADRRQPRQTYIFSATLTMEQVQPTRQIKKKRKIEKNSVKHKLGHLVEQMGIKGKPKVVDLTRKEAVVHTLTEAKINCQADEKDLYLYYLLHQYRGRTLVFCNSKDCIRRLVSVFTLLNCNPLPLHADMHQRQRLKNLDRFTEKTTSLLLASDVAARGLDIPNVDHVIHYQVPRTVENYVHRSGRTARASKEGLSVVLVSPEDVPNFRKIINHIKQGEDLPDFPLELDTVRHLQSQVSLACEIDRQEHRLLKQKWNKNWMQKAAKEMDIDLDEDLLQHLLQEWKPLQTFFTEECKKTPSEGRNETSTNAKTDTVKTRVKTFLDRRTSRLYALFLSFAIESEYNIKPARELMCGSATREYLESSGVNEKIKPQFFKDVIVFYQTACTYLRDKVVRSGEPLWTYAEIADVTLKSTVHFSQQQYFLRRFLSLLPDGAAMNDLEMEFNDFKCCDLSGVISLQTAEVMWAHTVGTYLKDEGLEWDAKIQISAKRHAENSFNTSEQCVLRAHLQFDDDDDYDHNKDVQLKQVKSLKARLQALLRQPVLPTKFSSHYLTKTGQLVLPIQNASASAVMDVKRTGKKRKHREAM